MAVTLNGQPLTLCRETDGRKEQLIDVLIPANGYLSKDCFLEFFNTGALDESSRPFLLLTVGSVVFKTPLG